MSSLILPAKTATTTVQCDCTVCNGLRAEVPVGMLNHSKPGTKAHRTVIHNLVCIAWSPVAAGTNIRRIRFTATFSAKQNSWYVADPSGECVSGLYDTEDDAKTEAAEMHAAEAR